MALGRAEQRSIVAKVRVYELAKEFGVESKAVMAELEKMGEFVRSASSTIEAPVVRRLKEQFAGDSAKSGRQGQRAAAPAGRRDEGADGRRDRGPGQVSSDGVNGAPSAPAAQVAPAPIAADRGSVADTSADTSSAPGAAETRPGPRPAPPRP